MKNDSYLSLLIPLDLSIDDQLNFHPNDVVFLGSWTTYFCADGSEQLLSFYPNPSHSCFIHDSSEHRNGCIQGLDNEIPKFDHQNSPLQTNRDHLGNRICLDS